MSVHHALISKLNWCVIASFFSQSEGRSNGMIEYCRPASRCLLSGDERVNDERKKGIVGVELRLSQAGLSLWI